ncbi:unnamed protein product [Rotaria socialis]|uniref:MICOS complex subunit n=2 Tax=Rotaria socialis TaxID=392032 RepID=A0A817U9T7_9BILA|nr:unnamed protein product [Rotaria socialis]CAF3372610.1 unnamed protein product [Rotaria socialis]CAF4525076.1 unnamed protein product [Rotaria socialis]CAF4725060.1 unnamed protein product [Rotaria socialis]
MPSPPGDNTGSTENSRVIRVRDLPIYYDSKADDDFRYAPRVGDDQKKSTNNSWLYSSISQTRQSLQQLWNDNKGLRLRITRGLETGEAHSKATIDYIRDDQTFLPKVGVVTIAGLGGLLLGHKSGPIRKTFYSSVAVAVALSACYPKQSANLLDQVCIRIKNESKNLFDSKSNSSLPSVLANKDRVLHTAKTQNEPIANVKGDYGQGTPADQHLYTTRGSANPTLLDAEKKL